MSLFKERLIQKVKDQVACDDNFMDNLALAVVEGLDYARIAEEIEISSSDIASYISTDDLAEKVAETVDLDDLASEVEVDYSEVARIVKRDISMTALNEAIADEVVKQIRSEFGV